MRAAESLEQQKVLMSQAQTRIKLLASARTSEQAEELRVSIRRLAKSVGPELTVTEFDVLADRISDRRELFIQQAKKDMSLPS